VPELLRGEPQAKVVANIPYSITSPLLEHLLRHKAYIPRIVLTVQKEVAERLTAKPSTPAYGALSLFVQYHCEAEYLGRVPNTAFYPQPEVDSAIVRLTPIPDRLPPDAQKWFFRLTRAGFGKRRKTLRNALTALFDDADRASAILRRANIPISRAPKSYRSNSGSNWRVKQLKQCNDYVIPPRELLPAPLDSHYDAVPDYHRRAEGNYLEWLADRLYSASARLASARAMALKITR
jgi:16S rRNA A1518/A1519 N6-dimethyltransferase RsmA/KsgA/DIM1 with predicted DNA glycosylase/AP lyase activity